MRKKMLSLVLALCMMLSLVPMTALAEGESSTTPTVEAGKAMLNGQTYETLDAAMEAAVSGDTIYLGAGTYQGSSDANQGKGAGKTLTFVGAGTDQTTWNILENGYRGGGDGYVDYSFDNRANSATSPVTVTFKNMTMVSSVNLSGTNTTGNYGDNDYLRGLVGIDNMVLENCVVNGIISYWGYTSTTCNNVVFNAPTMTKYYIFKAANYSLWTYTGTEYTFDGCTFNNNGKAINVYRHWNDNKVVTINFNSCKAVYTEASGVYNSDKMVMNINDSTMADGSYIINITGNNETVNYYDASAVTCSRLFSFGDTSDTTYNSGRTKVTMGGTTVWEKGAMVDADAYHLTGVTPAEGSYTNGIEGAENSWYAEGHKDHKVATTYTDWEKQDDGSYTRTATTKCGYCGWSKEEAQTGYQVSYDLNGGVAAESVTYAAETVVSGETTTAKAAPTKAGYTFAGWKVDETTTYQPDAEITVTGNITLTAQWTPNAYTVSFDSNGGTAVDSQTVNYNEKATEPTAPTKEATAQYTYTFNGWKLNGNAYNFDTPVTGDIKLVADWEETTNQYTLTYNTNGGTEVAAVTKDYGTEVEVNGTTTKQGYTFDGWYMDEACTQKADDKITLTGNVTVYAKWNDNTPDLEKGDHYAYIIGYEDKTVRPENNITRAEVATIFYRLLTDEAREANKATTNSFTDVNAGDWYNAAISTLANMNIITGYDDGTFKPNEPITRAELATIAARFDVSGTTGTASFSDVSTDYWAYNYIAKAAALGWVKGDTAEEGKQPTFRPDDNIKRDEVMTLVNRVLERAVDQAGVEKSKDTMSTWTDNADTSAWYYYDVQEATNSHKYERSDRSVKDQTYTYENWTEITENRDWSALEKE